VVRAQRKSSPWLPVTDCHQSQDSLINSGSRSGCLSQSSLIDIPHLRHTPASTRGHRRRLGHACGICDALSAISGSVLWVLEKRACVGRGAILLRAHHAQASHRRASIRHQHTNAIASGGTIEITGGARAGFRVLARCVRGRSGGLERDEKSRNFSRGNILRSSGRETKEAISRLRRSAVKGIIPSCKLDESPTSQIWRPFLILRRR
jgi:hypothetical protein